MPWFALVKTSNTVDCRVSMHLRQASSSTPSVLRSAVSCMSLRAECQHVKLMLEMRMEGIHPHDTFVRAWPDTNHPRQTAPGLPISSHRILLATQQLDSTLQKLPLYWC